MGIPRVRGTRGGPASVWSAAGVVLGSMTIGLGEFAGAPGGGQTSRQTEPAPREYLDLPVSVDAPVAPMPVRGSDGKGYLLYHLFVTNLSFSELTLTSVEIRAAGAVLAAYGPAELEQWHRFRAELPTPTPLQVARRADLRRIGSGRTAVLFADFAVDRPEALPSVLAHRLAFEASPPMKLLRDDPRDAKGEHVLEKVLVPVSRAKPIALSPPLAGGPWKCSGATDPTSLHQHETTVVVREGRARIPERFAIDFQRIDDRGNLLPSPFPDEISNSLFYGYGEEVLAVADAAVASLRDGVPENTPQSSGEIKLARPISRDTIAGNQVVLDLGEGRYAFYAHLQPGSLRVRAGDRVRRGQVLGLVGNSGNSVGPHLHFHVGDRDSLNGCEGLPFVIDSFDVVGQWPEHFKPTPAKIEPRRHEGEIPVKDAVVRFRGSAKK